MVSVAGTESIVVYKTVTEPNKQMKKNPGKIYKFALLLKYPVFAKILQYTQTYRRYNPGSQGKINRNWVGSDIGVNNQRPQRNYLNMFKNYRSTNIPPQRDRNCE